MKARWDLVLLPSFLISLLLMTVSQFIFLRASFYRDLGLGRIGDDLVATNYVSFLTDGFYLGSLLLTVEVSALATFFTLLLSYPVSYVIARMRSQWAMVMLAAAVIASFITIVIKVFGLMIIFSANGWLNRTILSLGLVDEPVSIVGNESGVVVGLMHFALGFGVLILYSVIQTIPHTLEEAAEIHGASRMRVFLRVIIPLSLPGIIIGGLTIFNLCMGAFTSAALLGGGQVLTLPVLIQRMIMMEVRYSMGGTLAAVLLVSVLMVNLLSVFLLKRLRVARHVVA